MGITSDQNWVGSAIGAAGSMISSLIGVNAAKKQANRQQQYNKELAEIQNQYNIAQWNRENAYNLPSAQIERLQEAGLNPNLIYGNPSNTAAASPFLTSGPAANFQNLPHLGTAFGNAIDNYLKLSQAKNINANTDKQTAETDILRTNSQYQKAFNENRLKMEGLQIQLYEGQKEINEAQAENLRASTEGLKASTDKIREEIANIRQLTDKLSAETALADEKTIEQRIKNKWQDLYSKADIERIRSEINRNNASANVSFEQAKTIALDYTIQAATKGEIIQQTIYDTESKKYSSYKMQISAEDARFELQDKKDWRGVKHTMDTASGIVDIVAGGLSKLSRSSILSTAAR